MRQSGGFYIELKDASYIEAVYEVALRFLDEADFESDNFWAEYLDENLTVDYETFIDYSDYNGASEPLLVSLCRTIAFALPHVEFDAVSHYCNESTGFNEDFVVHYDDNMLTVHRLEYLECDDYEAMQCPDCGGRIYLELWDGALNTVIPTEAYCSDCDKSIPIKNIAEITEYEI